MLLGLAELLEIRNILADDVVGTQEEWRSTPSADHISRSLQIAADLAARGGIKAEPAALFYALSIDRRSMGDAWFKYPLCIAWTQMNRNGLWLEEAADGRALKRLRNRVAASESWEGVRDWFDKNTAPLLTEEGPDSNPHGYTKDPEES